MALTPPRNIDLAIHQLATRELIAREAPSLEARLAIVAQLRNELAASVDEKQARDAVMDPARMLDRRV